MMMMIKQNKEIDLVRETMNEANSDFHILLFSSFLTRFDASLSADIPEFYHVLIEKVKVHEEV